MDIFKEYKPVRNKIALLAIDEALGTIWAYCQYLQINGFEFPPEVEVAKAYLSLDIPQQWISEWELELLAKEVIINGHAVSKKGRALRQWKTLSEIINSIKRLENSIYGMHEAPRNALVELIRIAHRQFIWQSNPPNDASIIRYYKIFNRPAIDAISRQKIGLTIWETYMCGVATMGFFLTRPAVVIPFKVEIKALSVKALEKFFAFTSRPLSKIRSILKGEQQYNANFAYAYNSLRSYPLVRMVYNGNICFVCPMLTLLYWRFTGGLYYELISVPEFANEFGDSFQTYMGEVIERACPAPMERLSEETYTVGKAQKRTVDWIIADGDTAIFLECKSKRLSWSAKASLEDLAPLEADIAVMAAAVVQVYKTLKDHLDNAYPHFPAKKGRKIFPAVVTLENWRLFGPVMMNKLSEAVASRIKDAGLSAEFIDSMPYSIWAIEDLEAGLQIMHANGIVGFMDGKLQTAEMRNWDWHGYMAHQYPNSFPIKKLFEKEYDEMFSELYRAQAAGS